MDADDRAAENLRFVRGVRHSLSLLPASAVVGLSWILALDLGGTLAPSRLAIVVALLVTISGPALLPFLSAASVEALELEVSLDHGVEHWSRRGPASWLAHGLAVGAVLGAPALLLAWPLVCLGWPLVTMLTPAAALGLVTRWMGREPASVARGRAALPLAALLTVAGPLLLATAVPAPLWLVDRTPMDTTRMGSVAPGVTVELEDAPLFVVGLTVVRGGDRELLRAPLGLFSRIANEPGRARLLWSERGGGYHVPFTSRGARADDSALDRVLARLDLGGALPIAITLVFVALVLLAYAVLRPARLAAPSALVAALVAYAAIVWAY